MPLAGWRARAPIAFVLTALAAGVYGFGVEPDWIEVTHHRVAAHVSPPLTIAHLTDLHVRRIGRRERNLLAILEREKPDVVVITCDSVVDGDRLVPARERQSGFTYARAGELYDRLRAPLGVWAVRGNWENVRRLRDERGYYDGHGVGLLVNESHELRPGVWLVGLDDPEGQPDIEEALRKIPPDAFTVALFHSPALFDDVAGRVSLALAGHTHGGQVRLPLLPPFWLPDNCGRYLEGLYEDKSSKLYVSRGVGTSVLPVRFLCRPEVAIFHVGEGQSR
jgi:predicted MPP superfamily phosphohydrolase